ncbi:hypothetical protein SAY87_006810 [Trapa incisa]|uniref:Uncharacterized protein n=1 Tax=Trapa incisa TaxID=236973 RepID=A0AAN7K398_9MYRT|nr:hypothetical protein SAY87_006810 [Trapa incisa]
MKIKTTKSTGRGDLARVGSGRAPDIHFAKQAQSNIHSAIPGFPRPCRAFREEKQHQPPRDPKALRSRFPSYLTAGKMSLLQIQTTNHLFSDRKLISSTYHRPSNFHLLPASSQSSSSANLHKKDSLFSSSSSLSSVGSRPFSLSAQPRRLLCRPPRGKYVREDYLVVRPTSQIVIFSFRRGESFLEK